jgi:hypothetical protein
VAAFVLTLFGAALAVDLELLEAMAIVLAVGSTRRPRDAVIGAAGSSCSPVCSSCWRCRWRRLGGGVDLGWLGQALGSALQCGALNGGH